MVLICLAFFITNITFTLIVGFLLSLFCIFAASVKADDDVDIDGTVEEDLGKSRDGSRTDDEVVQRSVWT